MKQKLKHKNRLKEFKKIYLEEESGYSDQTIRNIYLSVRKFFIWYKAPSREALRKHDVEDEEYEFEPLDYVEYRYPSTHYDGVGEPEYSAEELIWRGRDEIEEILFVGKDRFGLINAEECIELEKERGKMRQELMNGDGVRKTVVNYFRDKKAANPEIEEVKVTQEDLDSVEKIDIIRFFKHLKEKEFLRNGELRRMKKPTARKYRNGLRHFFNEWGADPEYGGYTEAFALKSGRLDNIVRSFPDSNGEDGGEIIDYEDCVKLIRNIKSNKERSMLMLLLKTGIRSHELVNIQVKDMHLDENYVHISHRKGGKWQNVCIDDECKRKLRKHIQSKPEDQKNPDDYLYTHSGGKQYNPSSISSYIKSVVENYGIEIKGAHDFRHTFAYQYIREKGGSEEGEKKYLQMQMSHSNNRRDVTEGYSERKSKKDKPPSEDRRQDYEKAIPKFLPL